MSIEDDIAFLGRVPTFGVLGQNALRILAIGAETRYLPQGEVLFSAGERADASYVVQEGLLSLQPSRPADAKSITVGPGTLLGEVALLRETERPATAAAVRPSTLIRITRTLFMKMLEGYPDAARKLRDHLAERAMQTAREMDHIRATLDTGEAPR
jgi:CRP-like cAMP-binding protein